MKFRSLRIALSAVCAIACVLLIALWVLSYWWKGSVEIRVSSTGELMVISVQGCTYWGTLPNQDWNWNADIEPLVEDNQPITTITRSSGTRTEIIDTTPSTNGTSAVNAELNWQGRFGFGLSHRPDVHFVSFPHWFLILLSAAFAAAPWIPWHKRFSLGTLLIAMTLVAVTLGIIITTTR